MKIDAFKKLVRELIQQELEEASVSSATPGYMTPNAFSGKKIRKKKIKEAADISALRARMKAEMDKVAKHRDDVKKHSGKFISLNPIIPSFTSSHIFSIIQFLSCTLFVRFKL